MILRKTSNVSQEQQLFEPEILYFFYLSNLPKTSHRAASILAAHLALSPVDLAVVVVLVLLAAMRGSRPGRWLLALLPAAWLVGGLGGLTFPITASLDWATGLSFLLAGALVAAHRNLPLPVVATLVAVIGAVHGFLTGAALAQTPSAALELTGTLVALMVVFTLVAGVVVSLEAFWARIAVRVLGSWIAARASW